MEENHCHPKEQLGDCVGKVLVLDGDMLAVHQKHMESQIWLATHGKGCYEGYQDTTIHVVSLYDKTENTFSREQFLGELKEEYLPQFAVKLREKLLSQCHDENFFLRARGIHLKPTEMHGFCPSMKAQF